MNDVTFYFVCVLLKLVCVLAAIIAGVRSISSLVARMDAWLDVHDTAQWAASPMTSIRLLFVAMFFIAAARTVWHFGP